MYHVSAQGVDERMINVQYYYYYKVFGVWIPGRQDDLHLGFSNLHVARLVNRSFCLLVA